MVKSEWQLSFAAEMESENLINWPHAVNDAAQI